MTGIHNKLKPGAKFLSHELLARDKEEQIRTEVAQVIRVNSLHSCQKLTEFLLVKPQAYKCKSIKLEKWLY